MNYKEIQLSGSSSDDGVTNFEDVFSYLVGNVRNHATRWHTSEESSNGVDLSTQDAPLPTFEQFTGAFDVPTSYQSGSFEYFQIKFIQDVRPRDLLCARINVSLRF